MLPPKARRPFPLDVQSEVMTAWLQAKGDRAMRDIERRRRQRLGYGPVKEMWAKLTEPRDVDGVKWVLREELFGVRTCDSCHDLPSYGYYRLESESGKSERLCGGCLLVLGESWHVVRRYHARVGRTYRDAPYWLPYLVAMRVWLEQHRAWRGNAGGRGNTYADLKWLEGQLLFKGYLNHSQMMLAKAILEGVFDTYAKETTQDAGDFVRIAPAIGGQDARLVALLMEPDVSMCLSPRKRYVVAQARESVRLGQPLPRRMVQALATWYMPKQLARTKNLLLHLPSGS